MSDGSTSEVYKLGDRNTSSDLSTYFIFSKFISFDVIAFEIEGHALIFFIISLKATLDVISQYQRS